MYLRLRTPIDRLWPTLSIIGAIFHFFCARSTKVWEEARPVAFAPASAAIDFFNSEVLRKFTWL